MPLKRHATIWFALAESFTIKTKSLETFNQFLSAEFVYKVMPALGKELESGLRGKFVTTTVRKQRNSALPRFLYEKFILIFDKNGYLLQNPDPLAIRQLRQLLFLFYKFETPFTPLQEVEASNKFVDTDNRVKRYNHFISHPSLIDVRRNMLSLLPDDPWDIRPHHTGGATADKLNNLQKRTERRYFPSLMKEYPPHYFFNTGNHKIHWLKQVKKVVAPIVPARLAFVPKDARGPRSICMEPHELMFIQKGLQTLLYDFIEHHSPAKGYVNFTDQTINRNLAYKSSIDRSYATIDLKDASDLVSWDLIRLLVSPEWYRALRSTRSTVVSLPDGNTRELNKFASMGSALCFPIEAMLFWSIVRTETECWVYGDDIIVPLEKVGCVIKLLEEFGLIVNKDKTCVEGHFRESCGAEFFNGYDISYIKLRSYNIDSFAEFANLLATQFGQSVGERVIREYEEFSHTLFKETCIFFRKPISERLFPEGNVFYSDNFTSNDVFFRRRWNTDLQRYDYRRLTICNDGNNQDYDGYDALFSYLTEKSAHIQPELDSSLEKAMDGLYTADYRIRRVTLKPLTQPVSLVLSVPNTRQKYRWVN